MKRKVLSEEELKELILPGEGQGLGIVVKMFGYDRLLVNCDDSVQRRCRIRGKLKRRVWIREGDIVLVSPWGISAKDKEGDIAWRYTRNQVDWLRKNGYLKNL